MKLKATGNSTIFATSELARLVRRTLEHIGMTGELRVAYRQKGRRASAHFADGRAIEASDLFGPKNGSVVRIRSTWLKLNIPAKTTPDELARVVRWAGRRMMGVGPREANQRFSEPLGLVYGPLGAKPRKERPQAGPEAALLRKLRRTEAALKAAGERRRRAARAEKALDQKARRLSSRLEKLSLMGGMVEP